MKKIKVTGDIGGRVFKAFKIKGFKVQFDQYGHASVPEEIAKILCNMPIYEMVDEN